MPEETTTEDQLANEKARAAIASSLAAAAAELLDPNPTMQKRGTRRLVATTFEQVKFMARTQSYAPEGVNGPHPDIGMRVISAADSKFLEAARKLFTVQVPDKATLPQDDPQFEEPMTVEDIATKGSGVKPATPAENPEPEGSGLEGSGLDRIKQLAKEREQEALNAGPAAVAGAINEIKTTD